jgi:Cu+-exporting ATPase
MNTQQPGMTAGTAETPATDPVCEMTVVQSKAAGTIAHGGRTYYFCSAHCKVTFEKAPERYAH